MQEHKSLKETIDDFWDSRVMPVFKEYVTIEYISPAYVSKDKETSNKAALEKLTTLLEKFIRGLTELNAEIYAGPDDPSDKAPPVWLIHIPGNCGMKGNVLSYGHLDKQAITNNQWSQPPNVEKSERGPFKPNIYRGHLYGRGTSDDGFATFTVITSLWAMKKCGEPYPDTNIIIDFDEESGSDNLEATLKSKSFKSIIGQPNLCLELDSSIGDYERLWYSSTCRGTITGTLTVKMLSNPVHSGDGGGLIPNPVNIMRLLLDRIQDATTGEVIIPEFRVPIPAVHLADAQAQAENLGFHLIGDFPWVGDAVPYLQDPVQLVLNKTWRAALAITAQKGLPTLDNASNVIVPEIQYQISMRVPPSLRVKKAQGILQRVLQADPPFGAEVSYDFKGAPIGAGWVTPARADWFEGALKNVSQSVFGEDPSTSSDGGTVPVLNLMTGLYPDAQILATGAAGPGNNEHGINENLDLGYTKQLALALAQIIKAAGDNDAQPTAGNPRRL